MQTWIHLQQPLDGIQALIDRSPMQCRLPISDAIATMPAGIRMSGRMGCEHVIQSLQERNGPPVSHRRQKDIEAVD